MKSNVNKRAKKQSEPVVKTELVADEWWSLRSGKEKVFLFELARFIEEMTEKSQVRIQVKKGRLTAGAYGKNAAGELFAQVMSMAKKDFCPEREETSYSELWADLAFAHQQRVLQMVRTMAGPRKAAILN